MGIIIGYLLLANDYLLLSPGGLRPIANNKSKIGNIKLVATPRVPRGLDRFAAFQERFLPHDKQALPRIHWLIFLDQDFLNYP